MMVAMEMVFLLVIELSLSLGVSILALSSSLAMKVSSCSSSDSWSLSDFSSPSLLSERAYRLLQPILSISLMFCDQKLLRSFGLQPFGLGTEVAGLRDERDGVAGFAMVTPDPGYDGMCLDG